MKSRALNINGCGESITMGERSSGHRKQLSNASREPLNAYDPRQSYRWNFEQAPPYLDRPKSCSGVQGDESNIEGIPSVIAEDAKDAMNSSHASWDFLGLPTMSPFGIAAGPLLNGAWCLHYAELGFDVVTYKTVRSVARECYEMPNLVPVACSKMTGNERSVNISEEMLAHGLSRSVCPRAHQKSGDGMLRRLVMRWTIESV